MSSTINTLIAYAVMGVGPAVGAYMYVKNSSKLISMASGALNKLGQKGVKALNGFAKNKQERSTFGTYMAARKKIGDTNARIRGYDRINSFGKGKLSSKIPGASKLPTIGMGSKASNMFNAQIAGMDNAAYQEDVKAEQERLGRDLPDNTVETARRNFIDLARSGSATGVQVHAAMNHMAGLVGGKSTVRALLRDQSVMQGLKAADDSGNDTLKGLQRGWVSNAKFGAANPDMNAQMEGDAKGYLAAAAAGSADTALGSNYSGIGTPDASGAKFKDWGWYAVRPSAILKLSHDHTGQVFNKISYKDASTAHESPEFSEADPGIRDMINDILRQAEASAPSGGKPDPDFKITAQSPGNNWHKDPTRPY